MFNKNNIHIVKYGNKNLYCVGNTSLLNSNCFSVAGTRQIDQQSANWLKEIIGQASNLTLVSGLALGSDSVAHQTALSLNMPQIAVLPSGVNNIAPKTNKKLALNIVKSGGLLVSEYAPSASPSKSSYVNRNKIIAQLGKFLVVPQFNTHSGTRHTVNFVSKLHKPIVVQKANYSGNQFIINNSGFITIIK